jgi:hypothetical protein
MALRVFIPMGITRGRDFFPDLNGFTCRVPVCKSMSDIRSRHNSPARTPVSSKVSIIARSLIADGLAIVKPGFLPSDGLVLSAACSNTFMFSCENGTIGGY